MMISPVTITIFALQVLNVLIHAFGLYLLLCVFHDGNSNVQLIYILNLCVSELLINLIGVVILSVSFCFAHSSHETIIVLQNVYQFLIVVLETGILLVYYMCMFIITLDRLMEILLNIRYPIFWNEIRAKRLMICIWIVCLAIGITLSTLTYTYRMSFETTFIQYIYPTLDVSFLLLAALTYIFIFKKFKSSRVAPIRLHRASVQVIKLTVIQVLKKSQFKVPILLITSFLLLMEVPNLVFLFENVLLHQRKSQGFIAYSVISILISYLVDGYIYIFLQAKVKAKMKKKLGFRRTNAVGYSDTATAITTASVNTRKTSF